MGVMSVVQVLLLVSFTALTRGNPELTTIMSQDNTNVGTRITNYQVSSEFFSF